MSVTPLPRTPEEVTPDWLSAALSERFPDTRVASVEVLEIHHGTNSNAKLGVSYDEADGLPETFFLKMPMTKQPHSESILRSSLRMWTALRERSSQRNCARPTRLSSYGA